MKRVLVAALFLAACAHGSGDSGQQGTDIEVLDSDGSPLLGSVSFWSRDAKDECTVYGSTCSISLPTGDYSVTFHKERAGRAGGSIGGQVQSTRRSGCLRARVHVIPGQKISCRKIGEFSCSQGAYGNLDCGQSDAARYGFKPTPQDEPPTDQGPAEK
jgi:hypothetical protein